MDYVTDNVTMSDNATMSTPYPTVPPISLDGMTVTMVLVYGIICIVGLVGNGLVIFVITRYTKMKTVTNMYILNLSIADFLFLLGLPFSMTTVMLRHWVFGSAICKIYFMQTCINMFTGAFTLTVMSGDRFMAVCYPITSMKYRTPKYAIIVITLIWIISFIFILPVLLYAQLAEKSVPGYYSCTVEWPINHIAHGQKVFILYNMTLGFAIPVLLVVIFYTLLIVRLKTTGPRCKKPDSRRPHRKVTKLVTLIIVIFFVCWLPYWAFQMDIMFNQVDSLASWKVYMFTAFMVLSYANSMVNPLLYAFTNETFRESFISAFKCKRDPILGGRRTSEYAVGNNNSVVDTRTTALNASSTASKGNAPTASATTRAPPAGDSKNQYEFSLLNSNSHLGQEDAKVDAET